mgnify:CR=1 FL=1
MGDLAMAKTYRGSKEYLLVYAELIRAAQYRGTVTYQEIAETANLPLTGSYMAAQTGILIGEISEDEVKAGRPMLSAITVSVTIGRPGPGFFAWAKELGRLSEDAKPEDEISYWEAERKAVYETWKKPLHKG